jgi:hypothetical protein
VPKNSDDFLKLLRTSNVRFNRQLLARDPGGEMTSDPRWQQTTVSFQSSKFSGLAEFRLTRASFIISFGAVILPNAPLINL